MSKRNRRASMASFAVITLLLVCCAFQLSYGQGELSELAKDLSATSIMIEAMWVMYFIERICQHEYCQRLSLG